MIKCVSDRFDRDGGTYESVSEFLAMCSECFGEVPHLIQDGDEWSDEGGVVLVLCKVKKNRKGWYQIGLVNIVRTDSHGDPGWDWLSTHDQELANDLSVKSIHGGRRDLNGDDVIIVHNSLRDAVDYHREKI